MRITSIWYHLSGIHGNIKNKSPGEIEKVLKKAKALYIPLRTIEKTVEQGTLVKNERGKYQRRENRFSLIDVF